MSSSKKCCSTCQRCHPPTSSHQCTPQKRTALLIPREKTLGFVRQGEKAVEVDVSQQESRASLNASLGTYPVVIGVSLPVTPIPTSAVGVRPPLTSGIQDRRGWVVNLGLIHDGGSNLHSHFLQRRYFEEGSRREQGSVRWGRSTCADTVWNSPIFPKLTCTCCTPSLTLEPPILVTKTLLKVHAQRRHSVSNFRNSLF